MDKCRARPLADKPFREGDGQESEEVLQAPIDRRSRQHLKMKLLNRCEQHRALIAIYSPHATRGLQPLDGGVFAPLTHRYSQVIDGPIGQLERRTTISKRDFFSSFWRAFEHSFTKKNIASAWS